MNISRSEDVREYLIIITVYILAHFLLIVNTGVFWDDWTLVGVDHNTILMTFIQNGHPLFGRLHAFILSFENAPSIYRTIIFLCYLFPAVFLNSILKNIKEIAASSRFFIVIFFALFPVNAARVALIDFPYAVSYLLFYMAFWILSRYLSSGVIALRPLSLMLFIFSFATNSLLVFYLIVMIYIVYIRCLYKQPVHLSIKGLLRFSDYILIVPAYWLFRQIYFLPHGVYEGHNQLTIRNLVKSFSGLLASFQSSFLQPMNDAAQYFIDYPFTILITAMILYLYLRKRIVDSESPETGVKLILWGIGFFCLAVLPYLMAGKRPLLHSWDSRHQLLVPLGASFIIVYGIWYICACFDLKPTVRTYIYSFTTIIFMASNIHGYVSFEKDSYKHMSIVEQLKVNTEIRDASLIQVIDNTLHLNATGRNYSWYEFAGLLKQAYGDEKRFASAKKYFSRDHDAVMKWYSADEPLKSYFMASRNIKQYKPGTGIPEYEVIIENGDTIIPDSEVPSLMTAKFFRPEKFRSKIVNMVSLKVNRIE